MPAGTSNASTLCRSSPRSEFSPPPSSYLAKGWVAGVSQRHLSIMSQDSPERAQHDEGGHRCRQDAEVDSDAEMRGLLTQLRSLERFHRQRQEEETRLKVRYVAAIAPWLVRRLQTRDARCLEGSFGAWRYATACGARAKTWGMKRTYEQALAAFAERGARVAACRTGGGLARAYRSAVDVETLRGRFLGWRAHAAASRKRKLTDKVLAAFLANPRWDSLHATAILSAWHTVAVRMRVLHLHTENRQNRHELQLEHCRTTREAAAIRCRLHVAEARRDLLRSQSGKILAAVRLMTRSVAVVQGSDGLGPSQQASVSEWHSTSAGPSEPRELRKMFCAAVRQDLAMASRELAAFVSPGAVSNAFPEAASVCSRSGPGQSTGADGGRRSQEDILQLAAQCARLRAELASVRERATQEAARQWRTQELELRRESEKTEDLTRRVSEATAWVAMLRQRNLDLAETMGPGKPDQVRHVQEALCSLATVSEELLSTA